MDKMLESLRVEISDHEARIRSVVSTNHRETLLAINPRLEQLEKLYNSLHDDHVTLHKQYNALREDNLALKKFLEEMMESMKPGFDGLNSLLSVGGLMPGPDGLSRLLNVGALPTAPGGSE